MREGDLPALAALFEGALGRPFDAAHYCWKLLAKPLGHEPAWVAEGENGRLLAHYAGMMQRWRTPGGERVGVVSVDSVTAPEARGHGLCTDLGRHAYERWRARGAAAVYGTPNEAWGRQLARLGHKRVFPVRWWVQPLRPEHALARLTGLAALRSARAFGAAWRALWDRRGTLPSLTDASAADEGIDALWRSERTDRYSVVRDRAWVQWRYLDEPSARYRVWEAREGGALVGYAAVGFAGEHEATLAELACAPREGLRERLLRAVLRRLYEQGVARLATLAVGGERRERSLARVGFFPRRMPFTFAVAPLLERALLPGLEDPRCWSLSPGDLDVV